MKFDWFTAAIMFMVALVCLHINEKHHQREMFRLKWCQLQFEKIEGEWQMEPLTYIVDDE